MCLNDPLHNGAFRHIFMCGVRTTEAHGEARSDDQPLHIFLSTHKIARMHGRTCFCISVIASKHFTSDDYRIILMPVLCGSFMFYAQKEASQQ